MSVDQAERMFPILMDSRSRRLHPDCPSSIPWRLLEVHEPQARRNHHQSLERLAERGGLDPLEMSLILFDMSRIKAAPGDFDRVYRMAVEHLKSLTND